jgi:molecular chaperone GrpE (heat shock protein)
MQELSAEAETSLPPRASDRIEAQLGLMLKEFRSLHSRVAKVEDALIAATEKLSTASMAAPHVVSQLRKLDDQLSALRDGESVNHRLFDTLHEELIRYRDNFLHESLQKPFIRDLVILFDDLTSIASQLAASGDANGSRPKAQQNLENTLHSLVEILHRLEVTEIEPKERVDRALHRVISYEPADFVEEDGQIIMRLKRGFFWRDKVLRPEEVVAKRFE